MNNYSTFHFKKAKKRILQVFFVFLILVAVLKASPANENQSPTSVNTPIKVTVHLHINKIYNINTVDETYQIDGYLEYSWIDKSIKSSDSLIAIGIYENEKARELLDTKLWIPAIELINIQGGKETPNFSLEISPDGNMVYEERFFGTFGSYMNFRDFPFDSQSFKVIVEPFSYDKEQVVFTNPEIFFEKDNDSFGEKWKIMEMTAKVKDQPYPENDTDTIYFSSAVFEINAYRMTGYYLWQVLFPLFIIIMASFVIFWIKDFGTQMGVGFTLMLTVVAFNFYSASILPKLPYQTFIEAIIIVGYVFIFLGIIAVIINYRFYGNGKKSDTNKLIRTLRIIFPLSFFVALFTLFFIYKID